MKSAAVKTFQTRKSRKMSVMQCHKPIPHLQHASVLVLLTPPTFYICAHVHTHTETEKNVTPLRNVIDILILVL